MYYMGILVLYYKSQSLFFFFPFFFLLKHLEFIHVIIYQVHSFLTLHSEVKC